MDYKMETGNPETLQKKSKKMKQAKKIKKAKKVNKENIIKTPKIDTDKNVVRQISNYLNDMFNLNKLRGNLYFCIHMYIMFVIGFISFFTTSVNILIIILIIVSLDAISIVFLHECPLTTMEKKYLGITSCEMRNEQLTNAGIMYNCDHEYEKQIELLINVWTMIAAKCMSIIFLQMFNYKLIDTAQIYTT
jgi:hypothetical protein